MSAAIAIPAFHAHPFIDDVMSFRSEAGPTAAVTEAGIPYLVNAFWTAGQRQGHRLHQISYRACFKPQLPEFFISRLTAPGDVVHDPFMGRGTTPVQAALMGRRPAGNDVNPLSLLLTRPRVPGARPLPGLDAIAARLRQIPWERGVIEREDLFVFYHPATLRHIAALRAWLIERSDEVEPVDDWIRMVALNRLTGHSPGFFSVYTLPPNQAVSVEAQRRINAERCQDPPQRDVAALILRKSAALLAHGGVPPHPDAWLSCGPAHATPTLADGSVALTVTSPPFLDIVQYAADNWLRCWFAGLDPTTIAIGMHRTEAAWSAMVRAVLGEQARLLRPGGFIAFEVGEVRRGRVLLERLVWTAAEGLPFERLAVMINQQTFTKTANCWGINNNSGGTNTNRIVILKKMS